MDNLQTSKQSNESIEKNISFFQNNLDSYNNNVQTLDSYASIRSFANQAIAGIDHLLDVGNGGVFDYDTTLVSKITALDLFLDNLPSDFSCPSNVILQTGSVLDIPANDNTYNGVMMVMLIHHLVGKTVKDCVNNMELAIKESFRVLKPGGKFIIIESCVPSWFYLFEKLVFPAASRLINKTLEHPATLQYPANFLKKTLKKHFDKVEIIDIPLGRWVIQFGFKFPTVLTPVRAKVFIANKL